MNLKNGQQNVSLVDDGYDSESMQKFVSDMKKELEQLKKVCFEQTDSKVGDAQNKINERIDGIDLNCKSLITETQVAISAI